MSLYWYQMAFNIKDEDAVKALRELAAIDGVSMSAAASGAISESLGRRRRHDLAADLLKIAAAARSQMSQEFLASDDQQLMDELYDKETGLPR